MDVFDAVKDRRSVREFTNEDVSDSDVDRILEAGRWAPSGLNNQPWRFKVVRDVKLKENLAGCTHYCKTILNAPVCITVFLDNNESYDRAKDLQAVGACIQNMLLVIHSMGLGAVWLGEILSKKNQVEKILSVPENCELMAVLALGQPREKKRTSKRKNIEELMF